MLLSNTLTVALAGIASAAFENRPRPRLAALTPLYPNSTSNAAIGPTDQAKPTLGTATAVQSTYTPIIRTAMLVTVFPNNTRVPRLKKMPVIDKNTTAAITLGQSTTVIGAPMCPHIPSRCDEWVSFFLAFSFLSSFYSFYSFGLFHQKMKANTCNRSAASRATPKAHVLACTGRPTSRWTRSL